MGGMYGLYVVNMVFIDCDLFINFGFCFDDRFVSVLKEFVIKVMIVYIDIDFVEIGKIIEI